jgi:PAS domain S-box-containing protein
MPNTTELSKRELDPSQARLRGLVELAPDAIFVAGPDGQLSFVNDAACRLLGYTRAELLGMPMPSLLAPEHQGCLKQSSLDATECRLRCKDGTSVPVEARARLLEDGQWQGFVRDIAERKRHQAEREALLARVDADREWLQTVLDTLPLGMLLFQPGGRLLFNRRTEEILGMRLSSSGGSAQYAGRIRFPDGEPVPPEQLPSARGMRGENVVAEEYRVERPDGSSIPVLGSVAPMRDAAGRVTGAVGVFQDMSERMRMEQAVRTNERLLRDIIEILPVGVWLADEKGHLLRTNPAGERIWKGARYVAPAEFGQYKGWYVDTGKPIAAEEWGMARAVSRGESSLGELIRIQCFDGSFKTIIHSAAPLRDDNGRIVGAIVVNEDITALQQTQEQLRAAVHDREQLLAIVAHDLRSPLSALMVGAAAAAYKARELAGGEPVRELTETLSDIAQRMSGLVDDLLAVSVATTGGPSMLKLEPVAASSLVTRAVQAVQPLLAREGLVLELSAAAELPLLHIDIARMLRVFANLLDNARKYTSAPGRITLAAEATAGGVRFSVANSGAALPEEELTAMFQPFWQAGRDRHGAGLGLAICRSVVEAHGGSIWAEPAAGQRVRVCFVLPRQTPVTP